MLITVYPTQIKAQQNRPNPATTTAATTRPQQVNFLTNKQTAIPIFKATSSSQAGTSTQSGQQQQQQRGGGAPSISNSGRNGLSNSNRRGGGQVQ